MSYRIITISRQFGSGGRTIGRTLAQELGISCYDREIIDKVAEESGFDKNYISEKGEYVPHGIFGNALSRWSYSAPTNEERIWQIQYNYIRELAEKECCIIIGRCADYILADRDDVLKVFIHANDDYRADRIVRLYGESDVEPLRRLRTKDKHRAAYYQIYTDFTYGDAMNYDICLDSSAIGEENCIAILKEIYRR